MNTQCHSCPLFAEIVLETVQYEYATRENSYVPDTRDNWTKAQVIRAAKDSTIALTRGQAKHASKARRANSQKYTPVFAEPIRVLIAECEIDSLRELWLDLRDCLPHYWEHDRPMWHRVFRVMHWIELYGRNAAYRDAPRELTDNEFVASVFKEMRGEI